VCVRETSCRLGAPEAWQASQVGENQAGGGGGLENIPSCEKKTGRGSSLSLVRCRGTEYSVPTAYGHREVLICSSKVGALDQAAPLVYPRNSPHCVA
jgi:hypothetical protein